MANRNGERAFLFDDPKVMTDALTKSVRAALEQHKRAQNYVVAWRDGKLIKIAPDAIPVEDVAHPIETAE